ncbi:hypothetical protein POM88_035676 [Heracleum sosnowskyi]|uniref:Uncharacterized protein n=1 Tax=Heracleum sosnowskyi TaxID=360622 RepID=A0AAD8HNG2_9APIA|nr:hypothetical protein POM88_035676 [Heracleum sosnowskyi]
MWVAFTIVPKGVIFPLTDFMRQQEALYGDKEQLSQQEYIRGISSWNFNLEDLKNQAALIQDYDISNIEESSVSGKLIDWHDEDGFPAENPSPEIVDQAEAAPHFQDVLDDNNNMEDSLAAFPIKSLQALKNANDKGYVYTSVNKKDKDASC